MPLTLKAPGVEEEDVDYDAVIRDIESEHIAGGEHDGEPEPADVQPSNSIRPQGSILKRRGEPVTQRAKEVTFAQHLTQSFHSVVAYTEVYGKHPSRIVPTASGSVQVRPGPSAGLHMVNNLFFYLVCNLVFNVVCNCSTCVGVHPWSV